MKSKILPLLLSGILVFAIACKKKTTGTIPTVTTSAVGGITYTTADCGGTVTAEGGSSVTARGVCWGTTATPTVADSKTTDGTGTGAFNSSMTGLANGTTYYARAYATNAEGTAYGTAVSFTTIPKVFTDNGNVYHTVQIGSQYWMVENLASKKFRNGDNIPNITDATAWAGLTTAAYADYDNMLSNTAVFGRLYNYAAVTDSRNIAPPGWHIATDADWTTLVTFLGGESTAGGKLKEGGTAHWASPNMGATNSNGFYALPGGQRNADGTFSGVNTTGGWMSATASGTTDVWKRTVSSADAIIVRAAVSMKGGYSVRCVKD
jgi:uncharacterized protein (TIGR02145 family)